MHLVLTSPAGQAHTFLTTGGRSRAADDVSPGDRHDPSGNDFKRIVSISSGLAPGEAYTVALYPSRALLAQYITSQPSSQALLLSLLVAACCVLFVVYECAAETRDASLMLNY